MTEISLARIPLIIISIRLSVIIALSVKQEKLKGYTRGSIKILETQKRIQSREHDL
jgi:hypothetical protein